MTTITRRQTLALAGCGVASLPLGVLATRVHAFGNVKLPIPTLVDTTRSGPEFELVLQKSLHQFEPTLATDSWGISASYLGPVIRVRSGQTIRPRIFNGLDENSTLHWHGLMVPSEMDGGPHNSIEPGAVWAPELAIRQAPATTWYHPHPHGAAGRQTWLGLAGLLIVADEGDADLGLPVEYGVDDLPLVIQDRRFGSDGTLSYAPDVMDLMHGLRGDAVVVNDSITPTAVVPSGIVRLRILNGANARIFNLAFSDNRPFHVVAGDGGFLPEPVELKRLMISPGERYELLVDFSGSSQVELVTAPDQNGRFGSGLMDRVKGLISGLISRDQVVMRFLTDSRRRAVVQRLPQRLANLAAPNPSLAVRRRKFVLDEMLAENMPAMMQAMQRTGQLQSIEGRPNVMDSGNQARDARPSRPAMTISESGMTMAINGRPFAMDRIDVEARLGSTEIWEIIVREMAHPFHIHGASFRVLLKDGAAPRPEETGLKDVTLVEKRAEILVRFDQPASRAKPFMYHCHILEHEDLGMMGQYVTA